MSTLQHSCGCTQREQASRALGAWALARRIDIENSLADSTMLSRWLGTGFSVLPHLEYGPALRDMHLTCPT